MLCAGRLGDSCLSKSVLKVLAGEADHQAAAGSKLSCVHLRPGACCWKASDGHDKLAVTMYYSLCEALSMWWCWCGGLGRMEE